ncbi:hypothetical protein N431DRAFT_426866 [Stipitochalara longipes BDJ]|nr:hypothetical protein N431DRAFT_426866 [Stipitochalara longipes BDJ]
MDHKLTWLGGKWRGERVGSWGVGEMGRWRVGELGPSNLQIANIASGERWDRYILNINRRQVKFLEHCACRKNTAQTLFPRRSTQDKKSPSHLQLSSSAPSRRRSRLLGSEAVHEEWIREAAAEKSCVSKGHTNMSILVLCYYSACGFSADAWPILELSSQG